MFIIYNYYI